MAIKGCEIVERIDKRRAALKMSRKAVAEAIGLKSAQFITDWSNGSKPLADKALKVADALGVSIRWLLTGQEEKGFTREEKIFIEKFRNLTDQGRYEILTLIDAKLVTKKPRSEEKKEAG